MDPVIQEEATGCAIASSAAIAGLSYKKAKAFANQLGIFASDTALWSQTHYIRILLRRLGFKTARGETPFRSWHELPDCALLAIKWHMQQNTPYWHWVVFFREQDREYVLDSSQRLKNNVRTDFGRIRPKWFIKVSR